MAISFEESIDFCRRLTKREARNFYFSFLTLPRAKRDAMCAIYAWMRLLDDLADDAPSPEQALEALNKWKIQTRRNLTEDFIENSFSPELWPAFAETVERYGIPHEYFDQIIEGALMDQTVFRYETFQELYQYCYRVASIVGLVCLRIFEATTVEVQQKGEWLGIAFQLTNILRDVREDAQRGRIYLPLEDLKHHQVTEQDILKGQWSDGLYKLFQSFADRAEEYYVRAKLIESSVPKEARPTLRIMTEIYHGILKDIRKINFRVFEHRARMPTWKKLAIVLKHQFISP